MLPLSDVKKRNERHGNQFFVKEEAEKQDFKIEQYRLLKGDLFTVSYNTETATRQYRIVQYDAPTGNCYYYQAKFSLPHDAKAVAKMLCKGRVKMEMVMPDRDRPTISDKS